MIPTYLMPLANHLWQSSIFAGTVAVLCLALRRHQASARFWLWLAASVKFLIPLAWVSEIGSRVMPPPIQTGAGIAVASMAREMSEPFALPVPAPLLASVPSAASIVPAVLAAIWFGGFAVSASLWLRAWLRMRRAVRFAVPFENGIEGVPVRESSLPVEPCVFGIVRPVLLVPSGIRAQLTGEQLATIFLHELFHVRRRDNLLAAIHTVVACVFWFYPPIYWIGRRLLREREGACDEAVLREAAKPETYAQGILAVCQFAVQAAPVSAAGVAGRDLKERIEAITGGRAVRRLTLWRKALVTTVLGAALGGPFWSGVLFVRAVRAQAPSDAARVAPFGVASIKPNRTGDRNTGFRRFHGGALDAWNITLKMLIAFAYDLPEDRVLRGPGWIDSERYDIVAKPEESAGHAVDTSMGAIRLRTQALLADRFQLVLHKDTRQLPIFRLLVDKDGPKNLHPPKGNQEDLIHNGHHLMCTSASMAYFAKIFLTQMMGGPVIDQTGIQGNFDFTMDWAPDQHAPQGAAGANDPPVASDPAGPSLLTALREQLGLKLEAGKGPVEVLVIDGAEKASGN